MTAFQIRNAILGIVNGMMHNKKRHDPVAELRCNVLAEQHRTLTGSYPSLWEPIKPCTCLQAGKPLSVECPHAGHRRRAAAIQK